MALARMARSHGTASTRTKFFLILTRSQSTFLRSFDRAAASRPGSNAGKAPLGVLTPATVTFNWTGERRPRHRSDTIIYEMHVGGFTKNPNSGVSPDRRGTYAGVIEKIPYLKELGITAVELMPIFQFDPQEGSCWGYMPLNFFSPHHDYSDPKDANSTMNFGQWSRLCMMRTSRSFWTLCTTTRQKATSADRSTATRESMTVLITC